MSEVYNKDELYKVQRLELVVLKLIDDICRKENIDYFVEGGTALGAIRHGGFIPWDDDIDVGMTRENYEKFIRIAPKKLPAGFYLQSPYYQANCPYPYSKIKIDGTKFVEYSTRNTKCHQGVYVDIFPFDDYSDDDVVGSKQHKKIQFLVRIFNLRQKPDLTYEPTTLGGKYKSFVHRIIHYIFKLIPYKLLQKDLDKKMTAFNYSQQKGYGCYFEPKYKASYILKEDMYPLIQKKFEDMDVYIMNNYDAYLKNEYGDYMKLPPESERVGHKPYIIDLTNYNFE